MGFIATFCYERVREYVCESSSSFILCLPLPLSLAWSILSVAVPADMSFLPNYFFLCSGYEKNVRRLALFFVYMSLTGLINI